MVYSPSQLDAAGDVDPVAEADVYLAYGRDLQAEEILKEAMRTQPQRVAIHAKLLEIYGKRRDVKAFELVATEAFNLTNGHGPEWEHICELGQDIDPSNAMYRPGGYPSETAAAAAAATMTTGAFGATMALPSTPSDLAAAATDIDLDLDFSLGDDEPAGAPAERTPAPSLEPDPAERTQALPRMEMPLEIPSSVDLDFGTESPTAATPAAMPEPATLDAPDLTIDADALSFDLHIPEVSEPAPAPLPIAVAPSQAPAVDSGMIEFDLGSLSLDLPGTSDAKPELDAADESPSGEDPLATKLALAQEFNAIGDPDGARSLAQEVLAEASGDLKSRAQKLLAEIG
jgi:pilus assembly protein FimV